MRCGAAPLRPVQRRYLRIKKARIEQGVGIFMHLAMKQLGGHGIFIVDNGATTVDLHLLRHESQKPTSLFASGRGSRWKLPRLRAKMARPNISDSRARAGQCAAVKKPVRTEQARRRSRRISACFVLQHTAARLGFMLAHGFRRLAHLELPIMTAATIVMWGSTWRYSAPQCRLIDRGCVRPHGLCFASLSLARIN